MKAKLHTEYRKTGRGASYGGYTERHVEAWLVCSCGWEHNTGRRGYQPISERDTAVLEHRIEHLEEG